MTIDDQNVRGVTLGATALALAVCILPVVIGTAAFGVLGAALAPIEALAGAVAITGAAALVWLRIRRGVRADGNQDGGEGADPDAPSAGIACDLGAIAPGEREDHLTNAEAVLSGVEEIRETGDGYAFRLPAEPDVLARVVRFIAYERRCCPFFRFSLTVEPTQADAWLELSGGSGVRAYLRTDLVSRLQERMPELAVHPARG